MCFRDLCFGKCGQTDGRTDVRGEALTPAPNFFGLGIIQPGVQDNQVSFTPSSVDRLCHFNSIESCRPLLSFQRSERIVHIAIAVLRCTHSHRRSVKHVKVKGIAKGHNIRNQAGIEPAQQAAAKTLDRAISLPMQRRALKPLNIWL